jgi:hypothetical protein
METQQRDRIIAAMARAASEAFDEQKAWAELPEDERMRWVRSQDAALSELERMVPKASRIFRE